MGPPFRRRRGRSVLVIWDMTPCSVVMPEEAKGRICCLYLHDSRLRKHAATKCHKTFITLHGVKCQNGVIFILSQCSTINAADHVENKYKEKFVRRRHPYVNRYASQPEFVDKCHGLRLLQDEEPTLSVGRVIRWAWCSHISDYEKYHLLGYATVQSYRNPPTFRRSSVFMVKEATPVTSRGSP
jgi:hypothetical protein